MSNLKRRILFVACFIGIIFGFNVISQKKVSAALDVNTVTAKAVFEGVFQCASKNAYKSTFDWVNNKSSINGLAFLQNTISDDVVKLPFGLTGVSSNKMNCTEVMKGIGGGNGVKGGLVPYNIRNTSDVSVVNFFAGADKKGNGGIGYKATSASNISTEQETQQLVYTVTSDCRDSKGNKLSDKTFKGESGGSFGELIFPMITLGTNSDQKSSVSDTGINVPVHSSRDSYVFTVCGATFRISAGGNKDGIDYTIEHQSNNGMYSLVGNKDANIQSQNGQYKLNYGDIILHNDYLGSDGNWNTENVVLHPEVKKGKVAEKVDEFNDYKLTWLNKPMKMVTGLNSNNAAGLSLTKLGEAHDELRLSPQEVYDLYTYYIKDVFKVPVVCKGEDNYAAYEDSKTIKWKKGVECKADTKYSGIVSNPGNVYGVDGSRRFTAGPLSLDDVINGLNSLDISKLDTESAGTLAAETTGDGGVVDGNKATCTSTRAGESLGWILCPVLSFLSNAATDAYNNYVEPALMVEPALFQGSEKDSGVRYAWGIFQGIANTLFIILLIVVIFSQLTGVGIDNYGIKKILPKLIIAAVLINLSYLICIICVDLSNILGNSFQALFNNISEPLRNNIPSDLGISGISGWADSVGTTAITGLAVLAVLAVEIWSIASAGGWPAILLALLVSALSIAVAIFFLFVLLAAREAAIIVLTVISPLAFACFILPNTKKFFDRWLKFGWGLLLVYPVCGLLVGGGNFVSVLMLSAGAASNSGFFSAFMAMIVGIVPIFFIPTVLKGSFSALGNLGAKISGMGKTLGNRWGGKVERGVQGTNRYKNYQAELGRRRQERSARSAVNRLNRKQGRLQSRGRELNARDTRMLARSQESLDKLSREDRAANTILMEQEFRNSTQPELESAWNEAFDSGDTQRLDALTNVLIQKHGTSGANFIGRALAGKQIVDADGNVNQNAVNSLRMLQDNMNHNSTFAGHMKNKASDAYGMISNGGMVHNESTGKNEYRNMDHFSKNNAIATDIKDWSTQSGATLERAIASGALTTETIEQILNSTDPSIQSGIQSDKGKRDVLQAHMYDAQHPSAEHGPNLSTEAKAERYREEQRAALQNQQNAEVAQRDEMARNVADIAGALSGGASVGGAGGAGAARENETLTIPHGQSSGSLSQDSGGLVDADDFIDYQMGRGEYMDERRRPSRMNQNGQTGQTGQQINRNSQGNGNGQSS